MAKVKEVGVKVEFLKSLPNYQNIKFGATMVVEVGEKDDVKKVYQKTWEAAEEEVYKQVKEFDSK